MPRSRSVAVSGSRASDIVDGIRKQMGLYTPPPLSATKAPLRNLTPVNVPYSDAPTTQSLVSMVIDVEPRIIPVQVEPIIPEVTMQEDSGDMEWMCEDIQFPSVETIDFDMEFERDADGDIIMKEPESQVTDIVDMDMEMSSLSFVPQVITVDTVPIIDAPAPVKNDSPASFPSTLLASPILVGSSSSAYTYSRKGEEPAFPSISEEDEGCVMKFTAPSLRSTAKDDLPSSSYMLGYVNGRQSSSVSTPDHGLNDVDHDEVPRLTI